MKLQEIISDMLSPKRDFGFIGLGDEKPYIWNIKDGKYRNLGSNWSYTTHNVVPIPYLTKDLFKDLNLPKYVFWRDIRDWMEDSVRKYISKQCIRIDKRNGGWLWFSANYILSHKDFKRFDYYKVSDIHSGLLERVEE